MLRHCCQSYSFSSEDVPKKTNLTVFGKLADAYNEKLEEESNCITAKAYSILSRYACESLCEKTVDQFEKADRIQQDIGDNSSIVRALCLGKLGRRYGQRKQLNRAAPFIRKSIEISEMKPHNKMQM